MSPFRSRLYAIHFLLFFVHFLNLIFMSFSIDIQPHESFENYCFFFNLNYFQGLGILKTSLGSSKLRL